MSANGVTRDLRPGQRVVLSGTGNGRVEGHPATVERLEPWGAHCRTDATVTGRYRAAWEEMVPAPPELPPTGDCCRQCGSVNVTRAGACDVCLDCGTSGGCS